MDVGNGGAVTVSGNTVTIPLTNVANAQTINVTLSGVTDGSAFGNVVIPMSRLLGDVVGNGTVNSTDIGVVKSQTSSAVDATTFRSDVNANGAINATDVAIVKAATGTGLQ